MQLSIVVAAGIVALAVVPATPAQTVSRPRRSQIQTHHDFSAAKRKQRVRGQQAYGSGQQIACTHSAAIRSRAAAGSCRGATRSPGIRPAPTKCTAPITARRLSCRTS